MFNQQTIIGLFNLVMQKLLEFFKIEFLPNFRINNQLTLDRKNQEVYLNFKLETLRNLINLDRNLL